jgi:hypothetical protein
MLKKTRHTLAVLKPARDGIQPRKITPLAAPELVVAMREVCCELCENNSGGKCRLFGCCHKNIAGTVRMALEQCPAGRWGRWLPGGWDADPAR